MSMPEQLLARAAAVLSPPAGERPHLAEDVEAGGNSPFRADAAAQPPAPAAVEGGRATHAPVASTAPEDRSASAVLPQQCSPAGDSVITISDAHSLQRTAEAVPRPAAAGQGASAAATKRWLEDAGQRLSSAPSGVAGGPAAAHHTPDRGSDMGSSAQAPGPHALSAHEAARPPSKVKSAMGALTRWFAPRGSSSQARSAVPEPEPDLALPPDAALRAQHGSGLRAGPAEPDVAPHEHPAKGPVSPADEHARDRAPAALPAPLVPVVAGAEDAASSMHGEPAPALKAFPGTPAAAEAAGPRTSAGSAEGVPLAAERAQHSELPASPLAAAAQSEAGGDGAPGLLAGELASVLVTLTGCRHPHALLVHLCLGGCRPHLDVRHGDGRC